MDVGCDAENKTARISTCVTEGKRDGMDREKKR